MLHVSDFLTLFMMFFKYGLFLLRSYLIDSAYFISITITFIFIIIITQKVTYSYWFIIMFLSMLKKVPYISDYSFLLFYSLFSI